MTRQVTSDGYEIIPEVKPYEGPAIKGAQCGKCGLRVKNYEPIGYCCQQNNCPMGLGSRAMYSGPSAREIWATAQLMR